LLPAGAKIAGWVSHPLENAAFARRTPTTDVQKFFLKVRNVLLSDVQGVDADRAMSQIHALIQFGR
jgi:hypothetical protein